MRWEEAQIPRFASNNARRSRRSEASAGGARRKHIPKRIAAADFPSLADIVAAAYSGKEDEKLVAVYFLLLDRRVVYVGQTISIERRIPEHRQAGKQFDAVAFFETSPQFADALEAAYIYLLEPPLNAEHKLPGHMLPAGFLPIADIISSFRASHLAEVQSAFYGPLEQ